MKKRSIGALAYKNIQNNKGRYFKQAAMVMVLTWTMLLGLIIIVSISSGLERLRDRMGADLMLVPLGYERSAEGILIKGEPKYFYFEQDIMTQLENADIEGIERLSSQFYLTSSNQGCCDIPVQFIGLDKDSDFTIKPWIKTLYVNEKDYLNDGYIVVGS
ncbi:MAG TPA: ABC transporter permease, partial [Lachnospiraceae bacterium]|nr:ABC transporter permease [Lachnospiraceae bacterium]